MVVVRLELMANNPWRCAMFEDGERSNDVAVYNGYSIEQSVKIYRGAAKEVGALQRHFC